MKVSHSVVSDSLQSHRLLASQAPLSVGFSRPEYWSGLPFPSPGIEPRSPVVLALTGRFFTISATREAQVDQSHIPTMQIWPGPLLRQNLLTTCRIQCKFHKEDEGPGPHRPLCPPTLRHFINTVVTRHGCLSPPPNI